MPPDAHKVGPTSLAARSGTTKTMTILDTRRDAGKAQLRDSHVWPKDDHPFARQLRSDPDFVWARMMASVPGGLD